MPVDGALPAVRPGTRSGLDEESRDLHNAKFWEHLQHTFEQARQMLEQKARELGLDLDAVDDEEIQAALAAADDFVDQHPLHDKALAYADLVNAWFDGHERLFADKGDELVQHAALGLVGRIPRPKRSDWRTRWTWSAGTSTSFRPRSTAPDRRLRRAPGAAR